VQPATDARCEETPLLLRPFIGLLYQTRMIDGDDCEAIRGINEWQDKPKYSEKPAPVPLCRPQIPHDVTRARTRDAAVGSRRLTARTAARYTHMHTHTHTCTHFQAVSFIQTGNCVIVSSTIFFLQLQTRVPHVRIVISCVRY
jgi:hypothetical protein